MESSKEVMPASIVMAICAVQSTLESVKKSQKNEHGRYMFASTDDIYAAITRKMGEVGLLCMALESDIEMKTVQNEKGEAKQWLKATYAFMLATKDDTWTHPGNKRTLFLQITGPQTFQAAQSYCEKSYLRSLFKIPTGDMDLDSLPADYEYSPISFKKSVPPPPPEVNGDLTQDREFLSEVTAPADEEQMDLEAAIQAELVAVALANFQTKAHNASEAEEVSEAFEEFEAETDGKCSADARHAAEAIMEEHLARLVK